MTRAQGTALSSPAHKERAEGALFGRFDVLEELGAGAFGRVLLCRDLESGELTAVKQLLHVNPEALLRFKNEFRVLADLQHPNLARLGELFESDQGWGFSLEYVPGHDPLSWVRTAFNDPIFDAVKLRSMLVELLRALDDLHALGLLHRDIKPANIRITSAGRVVLLDFGLATRLAATEQTNPGMCVGSPAYMAPEAGGGAQLTEASDLYAVGVILYEALTGTLPFDGTTLQILLAKTEGPPRRPSALVSGVPHDLDELCMRLLVSDPARRIGAQAALSLLLQDAATRNSPSHARAETEFVGRANDLAALHEHYQSVRHEGFRMLLVHGESGIGKSTLVRRFSSELAQQNPRALVLAGKCHPAEQLGYKAFDGVVDELSHYLKGLSHDERAELLPDDAYRLPILFPVLALVPGMERGRRVPFVRAQQVDRFALFDTFRELLVRLARERELLFVVDDLQWADETSLGLLKFLLDSPRAPRLVLLGTVRPLENLGDTVGHGLQQLAGHAHAWQLAVKPLCEEDALELASRLTDQPRSTILAALVRESGGHPLFVSELSRHVLSLGGSQHVQDLDAVLLARVDRLSPEERIVFELICASGGPLPTTVLRRAREHATDTSSVLTCLRMQHLLRIGRRNESVVYHDRIREAVLSRLDPQRLIELHRRLARAWEASDAPEAVRVAEHWMGCLERERALPWLQRAADDANAASAFEQAVEYYAKLVSLTELTGKKDDVHTLRVALSEALASAGRFEQSAHVLLGTLGQVEARDATELAIRAAQRLLQAANVDEGLAAAERAFGLLRMAWPKTQVGLVTRFLWHRAVIRMRGLETKSAPAPIDDAVKTELDALLRLALPTAWVDLVRAAELGARHTKLALSSGDAYHLAYALSTEISIRSLEEASAEEVHAVTARAASYREQANQPELEPHELFHRGSAAALKSNLRISERYLLECEEIYRTAHPGAVWELSNARGSLLGVLFMAGKFRQHHELAQRWFDEAMMRGDRFAQATISVRGHGWHRHLYAGDAPEKAQAEILEVMSPWRARASDMLHVVEAVASGWVFAYQGGRGAQAFWTDSWSRLEKSLLYRMPFFRDWLLVARLNSAVAGTVSPEPEPGAREDVEHMLRRLAKSRTPWGRGMAAFYEAQYALHLGQTARAATLAASGRGVLAEIGSCLERPAALLLAQAEGAEDRHAREQELLSWYRAEGFACPEKALYAQLPIARAWHKPAL